MIVDSAKIPIQNEVAHRGGLGLMRVGRELLGPCQKCGGRDRFSVSLQKQVFFCRGCNAAGDVIALVQFLDGCDFRTAVRTLGYRAEMGGRNGENRQIHHLPERAKVDTDNQSRALRLWDDAVSITGTIGEAYLRRRGLHDLPSPDVIRLLNGCPFDGGRQICLIALYRNFITNQPQAITRTAIDANGNKIGRLSLGSTKGAAIKIDADENVEYGLTIAEGVETALATRQLGFKPCWALGSSGAIRAFPLLVGVESLTIAVDHDLADRLGRQAGQEAARECARRWHEAGKEVQRLLPKKAGADFNDLIPEVRHG